MISFMEARRARTVWHHLETINAVAYFSPESRALPDRLGLKGFWMGYFAARAAPMGPVGAGVVEATFFNFHPGRVRRAIPEAWSLASPADVMDARATAAAAALRRLLPDGAADRLADTVLPVLDAAIGTAAAAGRPLFAANRDVSRPADPVGALWQGATTLREHRGDAHVALLAGAGLDGCESHVLFVAGSGTGRDLYLMTRGWSEDDWDAAAIRLVERGLLAQDLTLTPKGEALRREIERRTDELAVPPYAALGEEAVDRLLATCGPATERIAAAEEIIYPNPIGLPRPT